MKNLFTILFLLLAALCFGLAAAGCKSSTPPLPQKAVSKSFQLSDANVVTPPVTNRIWHLSVLMEDSDAGLSWEVEASSNMVNWVVVTNFTAVVGTNDNFYQFSNTNAQEFFRLELNTNT